MPSKEKKNRCADDPYILREILKTRIYLYQRQYKSKVRCIRTTKNDVIDQLNIMILPTSSWKSNARECPCFVLARMKVYWDVSSVKKVWSSQLQD